MGQLVGKSMDALEQCVRRLAEEVKKKSYCEFTVKMDAGEIVIWTVLKKEKPKVVGPAHNP